jgi:hypothetical protein
MQQDHQTINVSHDQARVELQKQNHVMQSQLIQYKNNGHISGQVETLRNLAVVASRLGNTRQSLDYLDAAEKLLAGLGKSDFAQISSEIHAKSATAAEEFIQTRIDMISKMKIAISRQL